MRNSASVLGTKVGRIRVESVLGRGGMGEVYLGYDETLQRQVALKSIRGGRRLSAEAKARFVREARILSRLDHPSICKIHDFVEGKDRDYLVLELIRGHDLEAGIRHGLDPSRRLPIARKIAEVLVAAHAEGVIHRDLKPANVMLTDSGEVKVLDFGLARHESVDPEPPLEADAEPDVGGANAASTGSDELTLAAPAEDATLTLAASGLAANDDPHRTTLGTVMGTLTYMSPEQARGEQVTTASDMYSFGLLLQTLFTGRRPYPSDTGKAELMRRALEADTLPVTGLDADLTRLIESLKAAAPATRPTAVEAAARLRWIADRPKRRAKWLVAAAALLILALGGLKYTIDLRRERTVAVEARQDADLRRGLAEDLISFMLGDLRKKLEPVGRLEVLDDVGDKALEYFAALPEGALPDDELFRRSKALSQIGEVRIAQGNLDDAQASFDEALILASDLATRDPSNGDWQMGLGAVHYWIGYVDWLRGDQEATLHHWGEYLEISQRLVALDPENLDWQQELAYAHNNMGVVHEARGDLDRALETIGLSNSIKRRLVAADAGNLDRERSLANGISWLAATLLSAGRISESLEEYQAELEIRRCLVQEDPLNTDSTYLLAISNSFVGELSLMSGDLDAALDHNREAQALMSDLVTRDPANLDWRRGLAASHLHSFDAFFAAGRVQRARDDAQAALRLLVELEESDPSNDDWRRLLGSAHQRKAAALLAAGAAAASVRAARQALAVFGPLDSDDLTSRPVRSKIYVLLGMGHALAGRAREARTAWTQALEILEPLGSTARAPEVLDPRARALLHLGRLDEARPIVASLAQSGYAIPEFVTLCRENGLSIQTRHREPTSQPQGAENES